MPRPTSSTTIQRPDLGALAYEYMLDASQRGFIGLDILPIFEVSEQTAEYPIIPIESLIKEQDTKRSARGDYARGDWEFATGNYACEEYGWEEPVDDVEAKLYARFFDAEMVSTEIAVDRILRSHEKRIAALVFASADTNVSVEWSTAATATPRANIEAGRNAMRAASGVMPNAVAMGWVPFRNALNTAELKDALKYTNPIELGGLEVQKRVLAQYFGVDRILVGDAQRDSAKKGQSTVLADIWDDEYVALLRVSDGSPRLREPVYGRTFLWFEDSPQTVVVETYREEQKRSTIVRARQHVDEAVIFAGAKYVLGNITA
jgi:hypothetical protein